MKGHLALFALVSAMLLVAFGPGLWAPSDLADWFTSWQKQLFAPVCHQAPGRSLWLNGAPMAVCERCFGLYSGLWLGVLAGFLLNVPVRVLRIVGTLACVVLLADVIWGELPVLRVGTGLWVGWIGGLLLVSWRQRPASTP
jgi:uncharacterized membrane protein